MIPTMIIVVLVAIIIWQYIGGLGDIVKISYYETTFKNNRSAFNERRYARIEDMMGTSRLGAVLKVLRN